jgi:hypothetical protein
VLVVDPERVLADSRKLTSVNMKPKHSVGDISYTAAEKKKLMIERARRLLKHIGGAEGDGSAGAVDEERLQNLFFGIEGTPGDYSFESQKILKQMQQSYLARSREIFELKQRMFMINFEEHERQKAAKSQYFMNKTDLL